MIDWHHEIGLAPPKLKDAHIKVERPFVGRLTHVMAPHSRFRAPEAVREVRPGRR